MNLSVTNFKQVSFIKLEESKDPKIPWKMKELRKTIIYNADIQENVSQFVNNNVLYSGGHYEHVKKVKGYPQSQSYKSSVEVFSANETTGSTSTGDPGHTTNVQVLSPCIFCKGSHYNDECGEYSTLTQRKRRLNQQDGILYV